MILDEPTSEYMEALIADSQTQTVQLKKDTQVRDPLMDLSPGDLDVVQSYFHDIPPVPRLTFEQEQDLGRRKEAGSGEAKEKLTIHSLPLVVSIALCYMGRGLDLSDLIQEGNMALMRAVDKWDFSQEVSLSTYACPAIRRGIKRAVAEQSQNIRLPIGQVNRQKAARANNITVDPLPSTISINQLLPNGSEDPHHDNRDLDDPLADPHANVERIVDMEMFRGDILIASSRLTERERQVLKLRYGPRRLKFEDAGVELGITHQRVMQLHTEGLKKLRNHFLIREWGID